MKKIFRIDPKIQIRKVNDLLSGPVVIRVNDFTSKDAKEFAEQMSLAHNTGQPVIPVVVDSYGGEVYSLLSMVAEIQASKIPVATIGMGKSMSCGAVLITCGHEGLRFMAPTATIMIHDLSAGVGGKNEEIKANARQADRLQKQIFKLMAKNCGQESDYFLDMSHEKSHAEWYLSAVEAKKHKIVNQIRVPNFEINVSVEMKLV